jgi:hypothetical protein
VSHDHPHCGHQDPQQCEHSHSHSHAQSHEHSHEHSHPHTHEHSHPHGPEDDPAVARALLQYAAEHNRQHEAELNDLAKALRSQGKTAAADLIEAARSAFVEGNTKLAAALKEV